MCHIFIDTTKNLPIVECFVETVAGRVTEVVVVGIIVSLAAAVVVTVAVVPGFVAAVVAVAAGAAGAVAAAAAVAAAVVAGFADWRAARCHSGYPAGWSSFCKY